jgi:bifunctional DNA-binding transcriptional regulator/antitoxin component of YhaV-PrlF toxin-antitoxin module
MYLRKVLLFNTVFGFTIPKEFTNALKLSRGNYVEIYLRDNKTIVIKRHGVEPKQITVAD